MQNDGWVLHVFVLNFQENFHFHVYISFKMKRKDITITMMLLIVMMTMMTTEIVMAMMTSTNINKSPFDKSYPVNISNVTLITIANQPASSYHSNVTRVGIFIEGPSKRKWMKNQKYGMKNHFLVFVCFADLFYDKTRNYFTSQQMRKLMESHFFMTPP